MTILTACRSAAIRLSQTVPSSVFTTTDTFPAELADIANEAGAAIAQAHDWQKLTKLATLTGNGVAVAFTLPTDYDRMTKKADVHPSNFNQVPFTPAKDLDEWLYINDNGVVGNPGVWIILGGQMQIFPVIGLAETARFYYVSTQFVTGSKTAFTADTDTFVLPERLLTLSLIWRWRAQKRMEYAEDMANFEVALSEEIGKDRGSRVLMVGRPRFPGNVSIAYPRSLGS